MIRPFGSLRLAARRPSTFVPALHVAASPLALRPPRCCATRPAARFLHASPCRARAALQLVDGALLGAELEELTMEEIEAEMEEEVEEDLPWVAKPETGTQAFKLRPYQAECVEAVLQTLRDGFSRIGVSAPTGSGKTAVFTQLIDRIPPRINPSTCSAAHRVLILVGSIELAKQAADTVRRTWPHLTVEIEQGSKNVASGRADVTVATYQTLAHGDLARLQKFDPSTFKLVIVDEAHHAAAKSYISILAHFDSRIHHSSPALDEVSPRSVAHRDSPSTSAHTLDPPRRDEPVEAVVDEGGRVCVPIVGFTATFGRADGLALGKIFETIAWHVEWLDMIKAGWLSTLQFTTIQLGDALDLESVKLTDKGDFSPAGLAEAVDKKEVNDLAILAWFEKAQNRKSTLVFAVNIRHIISLTNAFRALGIDARFVHQGSKASERAETLRAFRAQEFPVLVNCGILTEGADFPGIDCVLLARPTKSMNLFLQMMGRGLRLSPWTGKDNCLIVDLVGNSTRGIVCTPTLFGLDPAMVIEKQTTGELCDAAEAAAALEAKLAQEAAAVLHPVASPITYIEHNIFDFVGSSRDSDDPKYVSEFSRFSWLGIGNDSYVLELLGKGYVKILSTTENGRRTYHANLHHRRPSFSDIGFSPVARPISIGSHTNLETLIRTADARVTHDQDLQGMNFRRDASWRWAPSSEAQQERILRKLAKEGGTTIEGVWVGKEWEERVEVESLNKGEASDVIARAAHGGIGWIKREGSKRETRLRREAKRVEKLRSKAVKVPRAAKVPRLPKGYDFDRTVPQM